jgi:hypothetical protein
MGQFRDVAIMAENMKSLRRLCDATGFDVPAVLGVWAVWAYTVQLKTSVGIHGTQQAPAF